MADKKTIHGDDLLYRFFQDALATKPELFAAVPELLITTMAIWFPLDVYEQWPVLLPWVVRDPKCRGNRAKGIPDEWASADARGYLRDDNSLVKSLPRALSIRGPKGSHVNGARMGKEFVAAHVWRVVKHEELASRVPLLNSFVPNLVWLPAQIAKLTDRESSIVQRTLQAMSFALYRHAPVKRHLREVVDEAWATIPEPALEVAPVQLDQLNWFLPTVGFFRTRSRVLASVVDALERLERGDPISDRVVATRFATGLRATPESVRSDLLSHLRRFVANDE